MHVSASRPGSANACVQHRRLGARVCPQKQNGPRLIDILDARIAHISRPVGRGQRRAVGPALDHAAQTFDQSLEAEGRLGRGKIANKARQRFRARHGRGRSGKRLGPGRGPQFAILAQIGAVQPLAAQPVPDKACLVGNPFFVHAVVVARQDAHDFATLGIDPDVAAQRVHHVDGFCLGQFPGTGGKGVGFRDQRAHRTQVDDVALQVAVQRLAQIAGDLGILATAGLAHLGDARHLGGETDAACAADAARHVRFDQRTQVQILGCALGLAVARKIHAIGHRLILKIAFAALVADRAIQRVVDEQKLHHPFARLFDHGRVRLDLGQFAVATAPHIAHLHRTGRRRLGRATHHFDKTHAAVTGNRQPFVIAETGNFDSRLFAGLDQRQRAIHLDLVTVDDDPAQIGHAKALLPADTATRRSCGSAATSGGCLSRGVR